MTTIAKVLNFGRKTDKPEKNPPPSEEEWTLVDEPESCTSTTIIAAAATTTTGTLKKENTDARYTGQQKSEISRQDENLDRPKNSAQSFEDPKPSAQDQDISHFTTIFRQEAMRHSECKLLLDVTLSYLHRQHPTLLCLDEPPSDDDPQSSSSSSGRAETFSAARERILLEFVCSETFAQTLTVILEGMIPGFGEAFGKIARSVLRVFRGEARDAEEDGRRLRVKWDDDPTGMGGVCARVAGCAEKEARRRRNVGRREAFEAVGEVFRALEREARSGCMVRVGEVPAEDETRVAEVRDGEGREGRWLETYEGE